MVGSQERKESSFYTRSFGTVRAELVAAIALLERWSEVCVELTSETWADGADARA